MKQFRIKVVREVSTDSSYPEYAVSYSLVTSTPGPVVAFLTEELTLGSEIVVSLERAESRLPEKK